jgi:hypothetical protein
MGKSERTKSQRGAEPLTTVLATFRKPEETGFCQCLGRDGADLLEQEGDPEVVRAWSETEGRGRDFFHDPYHASDAENHFPRHGPRLQRRDRKRGTTRASFIASTWTRIDQWGVRRQNLPSGGKTTSSSHSKCDSVMDPETFEYSIKTGPLVWFYDARFRPVSPAICLGRPQKLGLLPSMPHGGGQFSSPRRPS